MKTDLLEVSLIRPILIIFLVTYHSFAPWCYAWDTTPCFQENEIYWWIGKASFSFMIPMFVFISGYVFGFQREVLGKNKDILLLVKSKFERLYVPSIFFSTLYIFIIVHDFNITNYTHDILNNPFTNIYIIINGVGHMWFLPMLFLCFLITDVLMRTKMSMWGGTFYIFCFICYALIRISAQN